ncbi:MAG: hypothetical protein AB9879_09175 [Methanothrix sp.]
MKAGCVPARGGGKMRLWGGASFAGIRSSVARESPGRLAGPRLYPYYI